MRHEERDVVNRFLAGTCTLLVSNRVYDSSYTVDSTDSRSSRSPCTQRETGSLNHAKILGCRAEEGECYGDRSNINSPEQSSSESENNNQFRNGIQYACIIVWFAMAWPGPTKEPCFLNSSSRCCSVNTLSYQALVAGIDPAIR